MSDPGAAAVDATFAAFGKAATYTPPGGGAAADCIVILDGADRVFEAGRGRGLIEGRVLEVRASEIAAPARGGAFTVTATAESLAVSEDPYVDEEDPDRLVWIMRVS